MDEQLLTILKLCLLALLYLFFLRVLRAVWTEIRGPQVVVAGGRRATEPAAQAKAAAPKRAESRATRKAARTQPAQLAIVEPPQLKGLTYPLGEELTVGRAAGCQVTIDDTYASQLHARVFSRDGQLFVEDLGSTNGTYLNRNKVQGPQLMRRGDRLQVGNTVMELV